MAIAIRNNKTEQRYTLLSERVRRFRSDFPTGTGAILLASGKADGVWSTMWLVDPPACSLASAGL